MKRKYLFFSLLLAGSSLYAQEWPAVRPEARPATRWWWLGSAVDATNLTYNLEEYAKAGLGGVEITPIYGVQGNDKNNLPFLSPQWMNMLQHTEAEGKRIGIEVDMNTGTGWPFGGPICRLHLAERIRNIQLRNASGSRRFLMPFHASAKVSATASSASA